MAKSKGPKKEGQPGKGPSEAQGSSSSYDAKPISYENGKKPLVDLDSFFSQVDNTIFTNAAQALTQGLEEAYKVANQAQNDKTADAYEKHGQALRKADGSFVESRNTYQTEIATAHAELTKDLEGASRAASKVYQERVQKVMYAFFLDAIKQAFGQLIPLVMKGYLRQQDLDQVFESQKTKLVEGVEKYGKKIDKDINDVKALAEAAIKDAKEYTDEQINLGRQLNQQLADDIASARKELGSVKSAADEAIRLSKGLEGKVATKEEASAKTEPDKDYAALVQRVDKLEEFVKGVNDILLAKKKGKSPAQQPEENQAQAPVKEAAPQPEKPATQANENKEQSPEKTYEAQASAKEETTPQPSKAETSAQQPEEGQEQSPAQAYQAQAPSKEEATPQQPAQEEKPSESQEKTKGLADWLKDDL